jgi:hypothetical protein
VSINKALKLNDKKAWYYYDFACALSLKNMVVESVGYLKKAISLDERFKNTLLIDEDLENVRKEININEIFNIENSALNSSPELSPEKSKTP